MKLRPAAIPLITVDPFFSVWSTSDNLYDDHTKHWTGKLMPLLAGIYVDNQFISMVGTTVNYTQLSPHRVFQKDVTVNPLSTIYEFENEHAKVTLTFTTPLLPDRLDILTRPVSYVKYDVERKCDESKTIKFVFGIGAMCCTDTTKQNVKFEKTDFSMCCGNTVQTPLSQTGDRVTIDWGYLHLCDTDAFIANCKAPYHASEIYKLPLNHEYNPYTDMPYMAVEKTELSGVITLAYDEIYPIEYFGRRCKEYYTNYFNSFEEMVRAAICEYDTIKAACDKFDEQLIKESLVYGEDYKDIVCLAYRQAVSAHKLVEDEDKNILFLSKECDSNGCIGTLDVTYPSIPLFLKYNPELVNGMLRPILKFAKSDKWRFNFAPHDVGQYPIANGQVYGMESETRQMPVEECGNMLLCLAAVAKYSGSSKLFEENKELMKLWADYLKEYGYDPGNQLCTDDFAGHLAHNCNLSLKAILGLAAYASLSGDTSYLDIAKEYAKNWEKDARADHGATRLVFDNGDGWSIKYNIVWDRILGFNLFTDETKKKEIQHYTSKMERYGVPMDSRNPYTKIDWLMWSTAITDDDEYFKSVCESIIRMINETTDRVPLTDWYYTSMTAHIAMHARSVVGGLFIKMI